MQDSKTPTGKAQVLLNLACSEVQPDEIISLLKSEFVARRKSSEKYYGANNPIALRLQELSESLNTLIKGK